MKSQVSVDPINVYNRVMSGKFYSERLAIYSERYLNKILRMLEEDEEFEKCIIFKKFIESRFDHISNYTL
jgi:hypothetical protein